LSREFEVSHPWQILKRMQRVAVLCKQIAPKACSSELSNEAPLAGLRVVELASVMAAPVCGALLADYGADVIKVEDPKAPDVTRSWGFGDDPNKTADPAIHSTVECGGSSFVQLNRGKKSIGLDPTTDEGKPLLKQLLANADVFITNVRLKSLRKMGFDYEALQSEFPKLIYAHLSAFGRGGEMVDDPGYDFGAFWAQTGVMEIVRASDDAPMPREPGGIGDYNTGIQMLGGIFAALYHREKTGQGQLVDASLMRAGLWSLGQPLVAYMGGNNWATGVSYKGEPAKWGIRGTTEIGQRHTFITKAPYKCKDGTWIQLLGNDIWRHMPKMYKFLGVSEDTLLGPNKRNPDWAGANRIVDAIFAQKTYAEWQPILREHDIWYKPVHKFEDQRDPESPAYRQARAVGSYAEAPEVSRHDLMATPVKLSGMTATPRAKAPIFGQHTDSVLSQLGIPPEQIEKLKSAGVVGVSKGVRAKKGKK